jgi:hypothetical protein
MLQRFNAPPEIVLLRELEKWSYARRDFWKFRQCIHPDLIVGDWPREISRHLQRFYDGLVAGKRPKLVILSPPQHGIGSRAASLHTDPRHVARQPSPAHACGACAVPVSR